MESCLESCTENIHRTDMEVQFISIVVRYSLIGSDLPTTWTEMASLCTRRSTPAITLVALQTYSPL